jgi:diguanylate cyclase (GGDEF)-like protein
MNLLAGGTVVFLSGLLLLCGLVTTQLVLSRLRKALADPIRGLSRMCREITRVGDFSIRATVGSSPDIGSLAEAINEMLDRFQRREAELRAEIHESRVSEAKLGRLAHYDHVTTLHNRHFFDEALGAAVARCRQRKQVIALMYIDLDNFKVINDSCGHDTGDEFLRVVSKRLANVLRSGDVISRIGGDEFAIILENIASVAIAVNVAKKCLHTLSESIVIGEKALVVSASVGISTCPGDTNDRNELLKFADIAMYYAKSAGKNTYCVFTPGMLFTTGAWIEAERRFASMIPVGRKTRQQS